MERPVNKKKASQNQLSILVDFISKNRQLLHGKTKPSEAEGKTIEKLWEEIAVELNCCGSGPTKTPLQWKKVSLNSMYVCFYN